MKFKTGIGYICHLILDVENEQLENIGTEAVHLNYVFTKDFIIDISFCFYHFINVFENFLISMITNEDFCY